VSFLARLFEHKTTSLAYLPDFLRQGNSTNSGVTVNFRTALQVTTFLSCARVIAEGAAQVPLKLFRPREDGRGADPATDYYLYPILYRRPNPWQTSFEFRETILFHLVLCSNAYVFKNVVGGRIVELIPLEPGLVSVSRNPDLSLRYTVNSVDGSPAKVFLQDQIWHLRGPSWNSWIGMEVIQLAKEAVGLSLALEQSHASLHKNGVQTAGVYSVEGNLDDVQHKRLTKWIADNHAGSLKAGTPLVLDRAAKWLQQQMTGVDSQHLETRKHQIEEICRAVRVFPQMVGHAGDQAPTFASAEQFFTAHVIHTLGPWYERLEQSIDVNLLADAGGIYAKHNVTSLLRGDSAARAAFYEKALGGARPETAWMVKNEVRALEEMNPIDGGDDFPAPPAPAGTPKGA
jgi:HK97 family phage portal protein